MKRVISAGGVIIRPNHSSVLLIISKDGNAAFPKGRQERGETIEETALREVSEETGLQHVSIVRKLGMVTRKVLIQKSLEDKGEIILKEVHLFLIHSDNWDHQQAEEDYGYFSFEKAIQELRFQEDRNFIEIVRQDKRS